MVRAAGAGWFRSGAAVLRRRGQLELGRAATRVRTAAADEPAPARTARCCALPSRAAWSDSIASSVRLGGERLCRRIGLPGACSRRADRLPGMHGDGRQQHLRSRARQERGELRAAHAADLPRLDRRGLPRAALGRARRAALHLARDVCALPAARLRARAARDRRRRHGRGDAVEHAGDVRGALRRADVPAPCSTRSTRGSTRTRSRSCSTTPRPRC